MTSTTSTQSAGGMHARVKRLGRWAGPLVALICYPLLPVEYQTAGDIQTAAETVTFSPAGRATLAVMIWMGIWWMTEAVPIFVTAMLPLLLFPLLGIGSIGATVQPYFAPVIFFFIGGFLLALAMDRWGLGKRIALQMLNITGTRPAQMVFGFMFATAVLSAFVSNTATTAMMLPIAMSVLALVHNNQSTASGDDLQRRDNLPICLLLGIAYSASIGGIATIIGTPPNIVLVGFLRENVAEAHRMNMSFVGWLPIGLAIAGVFLPLVYWMLTRVLYPINDAPIKGGDELIRRELDSLGQLKQGELITMIVFFIAATLWICRPLITKHTPLTGLTDAQIAIGAALLLFLIPVRDTDNDDGSKGRRTFVMTLGTAVRLPWTILILFGGGLSLARATGTHGVADFIGAQASVLVGLPPIVLIAIVVAGIIFLTELTSNTATTNVMLPILAGAAGGLGVHPYLLVFPAAIAASCAFMLPVATPPNAIVFGSGQISITHMMRAGIWLNLIGIVLVPLVTYFVVQPYLGLPF